MTLGTLYNPGCSRYARAGRDQGLYEVTELRLDCQSGLFRFSMRQERIHSVSMTVVVVASISSPLMSLSTFLNTLSVDMIS